MGAQVVFGPLYLLNLSFRAPLLFENVLGQVGDSFDVLPIFAVKIASVALIGIVAFETWRKIQRGNGVIPRYAILLGPIAVVIAMMGEFLNDAGRFPYLALTGSTGLPPSLFMNLYLQIPMYLVFAVVAALLGLVGVFIATAYYALNKRYLPDMPRA